MAHGRSGCKGVVAAGRGVAVTGRGGVQAWGWLFALQAKQGKLDAMHQTRLLAAILAATAGIAASTALFARAATGQEASGPPTAPATGPAQAVAATAPPGASPAPAQPQASAPASPGPASQGPAQAIPVPIVQPAAARLRGEILAKDMADLAAAIEGRWDNEVQVFFEPEIGVPEERRHVRVHVAVRALPGTVFGGPAFYVEHRQGGESGALVRQQVWVLSVDEAADGVRLTPHAPVEPELWAGAVADPTRLAALAPEQVRAIAGCELIWKRRAGGFSAETRPNACRLGAQGDDRAVTVSERHDLSGGVWDVRDIGVDGRGNRVFGVPDGTATRFRKARAFSCWARRGATTVTGLSLHDQGGTASAGEALGGLRVRLRLVDWPIGSNRPSLTLYLLPQPGDVAAAFAWTDPDARRIAVAQGGFEASCTEDPAALWRSDAR